MSYQIPYSRVVYTIPDEVIPGNSQSNSPVAFHLAPAWGPDLARIKSVIHAQLGLIDADDWTPGMQDAVIKSFDIGAPAFVTTVELIEGLTVPARMALRAGLIAEVPKTVKAGTTEPTADDNAPVPVISGLAFSRVAGHPMVLPIALAVAAKIAEIGQQGQVDPRLFAQPSGSGGPGMQPATASPAKRARRTSRRRGTAASQATTESPVPGTSDPSR